MRRSGTSVALRLGMVIVSLCLTIAVAITLATPLRSEPGDHLAVEKASATEPTVVERPVAVARGFRETPNIRPEPAVSEELRNIRLKMAQQQRAEQRRTQQRKAQRERAEQRKLERRRAERLEAERRRAERQRAEQQRIERQKAKAERENAALAAAQRVRSLPAGASGRTPAGQARTAQTVGKMALSIDRIGLRKSPIETTDSQQALDDGLIHLPQTSRPWERGEARNVYVVGHRMGWPGTKSWKIFYRLDELQRGDKLALTAGGKTYRYKVTEKLVVTPWDVWVTDPVRGRDLLSLQTCTGPNFSQRLIVRADRV